MELAGDLRTSWATVQCQGSSERQGGETTAAKPEQMWSAPSSGPPAPLQGLALLSVMSPAEQQSPVTVRLTDALTSVSLCAVRSDMTGLPEAVTRDPSLSKMLIKRGIKNWARKKSIHVHPIREYCFFLHAYNVNHFSSFQQELSWFEYWHFII